MSEIPTPIRPFANGTERAAWEAVWCERCKHDHGATHHNSCGEGCNLILRVDLDDFTENGWPEAWLPEPDDGEFGLPSRMVCGMFEPCHLGDCTGDDLAETRQRVVAGVREYWRTRRISEVPR